MDKRVLWWLPGVDINRMTRMGRVERGSLETLTASRALNQQSFALFEFMEALEEMDSP